MILGLVDSISRGSMWSAIRAFSRVKEGQMLLMWWAYFPRWVDISMYRE